MNKLRRFAKWALETLVFDVWVILFVASTVDFFIHGWSQLIEICLILGVVFLVIWIIAVKGGFKKIIG